MLHGYTCHCVITPVDPASATSRNSTRSAIKMNLSCALLYVLPEHDLTIPQACIHVLLADATPAILVRPFVGYRYVVPVYIPSSWHNMGPIKIHTLLPKPCHWLPLGLQP
nr:hypothetical protein CFP56_19212 [Quercus suber]